MRPWNVSAKKAETILAPNFDNTPALKKSIAFVKDHDVAVVSSPADGSSSVRILSTEPLAPGESLESRVLALLRAARAKQKPNVFNLKKENL